MINKNEAIKKILDGDKRIILSYKQKLRPLIEKLIRSTEGDLSNLDDILQETFISFYEKILNLEYQSNVNDVFVALYKIAKNKVYESSSSLEKSRIANSEYLSNPVSDHDHISLDEFHFTYESILLKMALKKLDSPCKDIIYTYYVKTSSVPELASMLGYKDRNALKQAKSKCIEQLKSIIINLKKDIEE